MHKATMYAMATLAWAGTCAARTLEVGPGRQYQEPSAAIAAAAAGDDVRIQPGEYFDCAVVTKDHVTIEGVGDASKVVMTDKACQGKALLVIPGANVTVRNLTLTRARVPDHNGAGIRAEGTGLTVDGVRFVNNENGILSGLQGGTMTVRNSLFDHNGGCEGACAHGIYVGNLDQVTIEGTTFRNTQHAHDIKSRAKRTVVTGCDIQEGPTGSASYQIELPNGGALVARNNTIEKGPHSENHTAAITIGSEQVTQPTPEIDVEGNTFRNDGSYPTAFVNNMTATEATLRNNTISGTGQVTPLRGDGTVSPKG